MSSRFRMYSVGLALALLAGCGGKGGDVGTMMSQIGLGGGNKGGSNGNSADMITHAAQAGVAAWNFTQINESQEDAMGQSVGTTLLSETPAVNDSKLQSYVNLVGLTVASASSNPSGNYVFCVLDRPDVNAFSGPNGYIFITRGAVALMQDEAELAGVLGHEITHVCNHDGLHNVQGEAQKGALMKALQVDNRTARLTAVMDAGVNAIINTQYSQPQEDAADIGGVKIMTAAGYDPHSYLHYLQRLQSVQTSSPGVQIMSTHPDIGHRIANVQQQIEQLPASGGATLADRFTQNVSLK